MMRYLNTVNKLRPQFEEFSIEKIPRNNNSHSNLLATLGSAVEFKAAKLVIPIFYLPKSRASDDSPIDIISVVDSTWMMPCLSYIEDKTVPVPDDKK